MQPSRCLPSKSQLATCGLVTLLILTCSALTFAQKEKTIYAFQNTDGSFPQAPVIADKAGNLYGNLYNGGAASFGMTFELSPPAVSGGAWTLTDLHDFTGGDDGGGPIGSLAMDVAGNLYGVANFGAAGNDGLVFELSPPATQGGAWTQTVISAAKVSNGVAMDSHGNLYWTNAFGGLDLSQCSTITTSGCGSVFEASPPAVSGGSWTVTDLYDFGTNGGTSDALQPNAGVTISRTGALYGQASSGAHGFGAVYKLTPPATSGGAWTETLAHSFLGGTTDGSNPVGTILIGKSGVLYGTTQIGGTSSDGTVYQLTPPGVGAGWKETVIYNFLGKTDGGLPFSGLITDASGNLYGTTDLFGGTCRLSNAGCGTVFKLSPPTVSGGAWTETTLHAFTATGTDGANPTQPLLLIGTTLYGTTNYGGTIASHTNGTVFEVGTN